MGLLDDWAYHSFCGDCGAHRRRMPFGGPDDFFDKGVCPKCGASGSKRVYAVAQRKWLGLGPWVRKEDKHG